MCCWSRYLHVSACAVSTTLPLCDEFLLLVLVQLVCLAHQHCYNMYVPCAFLCSGVEPAHAVSHCPVAFIISVRRCFMWFHIQTAYQQQHSRDLLSLSCLPANKHLEVCHVTSLAVEYMHLSFMCSIMLPYMSWSGAGIACHGLYLVLVRWASAQVD
jgi:hypothetical protein